MNIRGNLLGLDIETTMVDGKHSDPYLDRILSVSVYDGHRVQTLRDNYERLIPVLVNADVRKIIHNASFDAKFLFHALGVWPKNIWDSLITERVIWNGDQSKRHSLDVVLARRLGVFVDKSVRSSFADHTGEFTAEQQRYIEEDVLHLIKLYEDQMKDVSRLGMGRVVGLENRLTPIVSRMEYKGVGFDLDLYIKYMRDIERHIGKIELKIAEVAGLPTTVVPLINVHKLTGINLGSTEQVKGVLRGLGINLESTNAKILKYHRKEHPFIDLLIRWRKLNKFLTWGYDGHIHPVTGRVHCSWNQVAGGGNEKGAGTGRYSSSDPNMQNVSRPYKDEIDGEPFEINFRRLFIPAPGHSFITRDFKTQEPGIVAQILINRYKDYSFRDAYESGDIYQSLADDLGVTRYEAKQYYLSLTYGKTARTMAKELGEPEERIKAIKNRMFTAYPGLRRYVNDMPRELRSRGYITTELGRRRLVTNMDRMKDYHIENMAVNTPVQGGAADTFKLSQVRVDEILSDSANTPIIVHDEMAAEVKDEDVEEYEVIISETMESASRELWPDVKITVDGQTGKVWSK